MYSIKPEPLPYEIRKMHDDALMREHYRKIRLSNEIRGKQPVGQAPLKREDFSVQLCLDVRRVECKIERELEYLDDLFLMRHLSEHGIYGEVIT